MKKLENEGRKNKGESINPDIVSISSLFDGITIEAEIATMEIRMRKGYSLGQFWAVNESIWSKYEKAVTPEDFATAVEQIRKLKQIVKTEGLIGELLAGIFLTESRLVYYRDKKAGAQSDEAYRIAMEGLEYAQEPGTKVSLLNVASDTKGELVGNYEKGVELANKSCEIAKTGSEIVLGKAENNAALRHLNAAKQYVGSGEEEKARAREAYYNAVTHFQNAMDAHAIAGNMRQLGHAHNNMILCYQGLANLVENFHRIEMCERAIAQADLAKRAYGDIPENALHAISANYRKGQIFELEAEISGLPKCLFDAIQCYTENAIKAFELKKWEKVKQELDNIQKVVQNQANDS